MEIEGWVKGKPMKTLILGFVLAFSFNGFAAGQDCGDCAARLATTPTVSMTHTNTNEMRHFSGQVESRLASPSIDHDLNADICDAFRLDYDFEYALELMKEEGLKFEEIYNSINCGVLNWSPLHIANEKTIGMKHVRQKIWIYFDKVKQSNPSFKYESILNTVHGNPQGTLLDYIDRSLALTSNQPTIIELKKFRLEVIERGGKRISEL